MDDEEFYKTCLERLDSTSLDEDHIDAEKILSYRAHDDLTYLFPTKNTSDSSIDSNDTRPIPNVQTDYLKHIREYLDHLSKSTAWEEIEKKFNDSLQNELYPSIMERYQTMTTSIQEMKDNRERLIHLFKKKSEDDQNQDLLFFGLTNNETNSNEQMSYFAIQSLVSILLILIKSAEKQDSTLIQQILTLTTQLCGQLPVKSLAAPMTNSLLFKSLNPLVNYVQELSAHHELALAQQAQMALLSFAFAKGSFKDVLPLLSNLIFNTKDMYSARGLCIQLNQTLKKRLENDEAIANSFAVEYLKLIDSYPGDQSMHLSGQVLASIILAHVDLQHDNEASPPDPLTFEFHPSIYQQLFNLIEKIHHDQTSSPTIDFILTIILRLFRIHLHYLSTVHPEFNWHQYISEGQQQHAYELLLIYARDQRTEISREASKALIDLIHLRASSFLDEITLFHRFINDEESSSPALINECLAALKNSNTLTTWLDLLLQGETETILHWCLDRYFQQFDPSLESILLQIQELFLYRLCNHCGKKKMDAENSDGQASLISKVYIRYLSYLLEKPLSSSVADSHLFHSLWLHLALLTETDQLFHVELVQPIFIAVLPWIATQVFPQLESVPSLSNFLGWLIGRICQRLIIGIPSNDFESKYQSLFKSSIFAGGCEWTVLEQSDYLKALFQSNLAKVTDSHFHRPREISDSDRELLLSIYHQTDPGQQLLARIKHSLKHKGLPVLQKSIEQLAHRACAQVFAVFVKHYRRLNLAKYELTHGDAATIHPQLLSIYQSATRVFTLFSTVKGQGGNCEELAAQIEKKTLFLLVSVKESELIPLIEIEPTIAVLPKNEPPNRLNRQRSRWSKAKHVLQLLQHLFQACLRFKRFMLDKRRAMQHINDYESMINRSMEQFLYADLSKITSKQEEQQQDAFIDLEQLKLALLRQDERALTRLVIYRLMKALISKKEYQRYSKILLPYARKMDLGWSYLDQIPASNEQIKEEMSQTYYSILNLLINEDSSLLFQLFSLINLPYDAIDFASMTQYEFLPKLFQNYLQLPRSFTSIDVPVMVFQWFRLFTFQLCQQIELDQLHRTTHPILHEQEKLLFQKFLLKELQTLQTTQADPSADSSALSLKDMTLEWFYRAAEKGEKTLETSVDIALYLNQYLALLLRCFHVYPHVIEHCHTMDYLQVMMSIYHQYKHSIGTQILSLRILRCLIPVFTETPNSLIEEFLREILGQVGQKGGEIITIQSELVYLYRTIISMDSPWQRVAVESIIQIIESSLNVSTIEKNDPNEVNALRAALSILGGEIESYRQGSLVQVLYSEEITTDDSPCAVIMDIDKERSGNAKPYSIQSLLGHQIEQVSSDKIQLKVEVPPPMTEDFHRLLDPLSHFIQIDSSKHDRSILLLQCQRGALAILNRLLRNKDYARTFMEKSYGVSLAKLAMGDQKPDDLRQFDREHLEHYALSLNQCESTQTDESESNQDQMKTNDGKGLIEALSGSRHHGWKPVMSEAEAEEYRRGYMGKETLSLVPIPKHICKPSVLQPCGDKHRFHGCITPDYDNSEASFPSFVLDEVQLSEGKWYYCVRLPTGGVVQIGWATKGFSPGGSSGVGDDAYSWSYDGSRAVFFHDSSYYGVFDGINWNDNDVCGCGIEINGDQTNIKYWLNGKFLGTGFAHQQEIATSDTKCNLLPHGRDTMFYPSITLQRRSDPVRTCELIFSPEDMDQCPLPYGYKPLLLPKAVRTENSLVDYPFSAYLIGDHSADCWYSARTQTSSNVRLLRDLVHDRHLEVSLPLSEESLGLPLTIDTQASSSTTISFDVHLLNATAEKIDLILCTFDLSTTLSIPLTIQNSKNQPWQKIVILLDWKESSMRVFINQADQSENFRLPGATNLKSWTIRLLPKVAADVKNLAIWDYNLSKKDLQRLFQHGLSYIADDVQRMRVHYHHKNRITFSRDQNAFPDGKLVLFNQKFEESLWEKKKQQMDEDERKYFETKGDSDYSTVQLYGNRSYLVLEKAPEPWSDYTLILELLVHQLPAADQSFTLFDWECDLTLSLSDTGALVCKSEYDKKQSKASISANQLVSLCISVRDRSIRVYMNNTLQIDYRQHGSVLHLREKWVQLFREKEPNKITIKDDAVRWSLKSLMYMDQCLSSMDTPVADLIQPTFSVVGSSLVAMGYKKSWIESIVNDQHVIDIPSIHRILREGKEKFVQSDVEKNREHYGKIFSKSDPLNDEGFYKQLFQSSNLNSKDDIDLIAQQISTHWIHQSSVFTPSVLSEISTTDDQWFSKTVEDLGVKDSLNSWLMDKSATGDENSNAGSLQLLDPAHPERFEQNRLGVSSKKPRTSLDYFHKNLSEQQLMKKRVACEQGLLAIYARMTIFNLFKAWAKESTNPFPLQALADYPSLVRLLKVLQETHLVSGEKRDPVELSLYRILLNELQQISSEEGNQVYHILQTKAPLLYHLEKDLMIHAIEYLFDGKQSESFQFTFHIYNLFLKLLNDPAWTDDRQRDTLLFILFPPSLIHHLFNIFLLVPSHQEKVFLLTLLTRLIRRSRQNILMNEHAQFFFRLVNELASDKLSTSEQTKQLFQTALHDLIFALREKHRSAVEPLLKTLPEQSQHLFTLIDMIDTIMDSKQECVLPAAFLEFSKNQTSSDTFFTEEDFQKCNQVFTRAADLELVHFIDRKDSTLIYDSDNRDSFFALLPKEPQTNEDIYKPFPHLYTLPADSIHARARYLYVFNLLASQCLKDFSLDLSSDASLLTNKFLSIKMYLLHSTKYAVFNESLEKTEKEDSGDWLKVNFDTVKASTNERSEDTMFYQAYQQLYPKAHEVFRRDTDQLWRAQYLEMHSTDQGGPYRDSITRIVADICSTRLPLFILCPNGRTNSGSNRDCWIPNVFPPDKPIPKKLKKQYQFVGQLMGMAIRRKHYLDLKLAPLVWKGLLNEEITVRDIEAIDQQSFTMLHDLEKNIEQIQSMGDNQNLDYVFETILDELRFDVVNAAGQTHELVPGGSDIPITKKNFKQYCASYRQYRLEEFHRQIKYIRQGLYSVVPAYYLTLFTHKELEEAVCGKGEIDVELLKRNTTYNGDHDEDSPHIQRFWTVFRDMFTDEQRKLFLIFVWGRNTLPNRDQDFSSRFCISRFDIYDEATNVDQVLPRSHTCFFTIDLPEYSTAEIMFERLMYAITHCSSIDGDGMINEAPDGDENGTGWDEILEEEE